MGRIAELESVEVGFGLVRGVVLHDERRWQAHGCQPSFDGRAQRSHVIGLWEVDGKLGRRAVREGNRTVLLEEITDHVLYVFRHIARKVERLNTACHFLEDAVADAL